MIHWLTQAQIDDNEWNEKESLRAEIRRLRAMVLRAHAMGHMTRRLWPGQMNGYRAARLLNHYATLIEAGRL